MKRLKLILGLLIALSPIPVHATDNNIFPTGPVFRLTNLTWGVTGPGGINNNFFFTPLNLNESVCVYVKNNNTTNAHPFTASIVITSDPSNITPSDGTWQAAASSSGINAAISPGLPGGIGAAVSGVSQVSINISASGTLAGSPETANVTIIQTTGNCFAGNQFIGSAPQIVSAALPLQTISDGLSQSFFTTLGVTNPGSVSNLLYVTANNGARTIYFDRVVVMATAATTIGVNAGLSLGTTCTGGTVQNQKIGSTVTSTVAVGTGSGCTAVSANAIFFNGLPLQANIPFVFDLKGLIAPAGTPSGFQITNLTALTGNLSAVIYWYEK